MSVYQVPPNEWLAFCTRFTQQHQGAGVVVEKPGEPPGAQGRLAELRFEPRDRQPSIVVQLSGGRAHAATYECPEPTRVELTQDDPGQPGTLSISSADAQRGLVLRFDEPLVPGDVDGRASEATSNASGARPPLRIRKGSGSSRRSPLAPSGLQLFVVAGLAMALLVIALFYFTGPSGGLWD